MPELQHHPRPVDREHAAACLEDLHAAREHLRSARVLPERHWDKLALRADLLLALEGYAAAIAQMGAPVPRRLLTEIELYRGLKNRP